MKCCEKPCWDLDRCGSIATDTCQEYIDVSSDNNNCGDCGIKCPSPGTPNPGLYECVNGGCYTIGEPTTTSSTTTTLLPKPCKQQCIDAGGFEEQGFCLPSAPSGYVCNNPMQRSWWEILPATDCGSNKCYCNFREECPCLNGQCIGTTTTTTIGNCPASCCGSNGYIYSSVRTDGYGFSCGSCMYDSVSAGPCIGASTTTTYMPPPPTTIPPPTLPPMTTTPSSDMRIWVIRPDSTFVVNGEYMTQCSGGASLSCYYYYYECTQEGNYTGYVQYVSTGIFSPTRFLWYCDKTPPLPLVYRWAPCTNQTAINETGYNRMGSTDYGDFNLTGGYGNLDANNFVTSEDTSWRAEFSSGARQFSPSQAELAYVSSTSRNPPPSSASDAFAMTAFINGNNDTLPVCTKIPNSCHMGVCGNWYYDDFNISFNVTDNYAMGYCSLYSRTSVTDWVLRESISSCSTGIRKITVGDLESDWCNVDGVNACQVRLDATDTFGNFAYAIRNFSIMKNLDAGFPLCMNLSFDKIENPEYQYSLASILWYNNATYGSFRVNSSASDLGRGVQSGISRVIFPATVSVGNLDLLPPYDQNYYWQANSTFSGRAFILAYDNFDNFGNCSFFVVQDNKAPNTSVIQNFPTWINYDAVFDLGCADNTNGSGCNSTYFSIANETDICSADAQGNHGEVACLNNTFIRKKACFYSIDNVKNTENMKARVLLIDKVAPTINRATPCDNCTYAYDKLTNINASIFDPAGAGFGASVSKYSIMRDSDDSYWSGSGWSSPQYLTLQHKAESAGKDVSVSAQKFPGPTNWVSGKYILWMETTDGAGNSFFTMSSFNMSVASLPSIRTYMEGAGFHYPEPVDIDYFVTFIANVTHPDYPVASVTQVRACNTSDCSQRVYCAMQTNSSTGGTIWQCAEHNLEQYGIGNQTYFIRADDSRGAFSAAGPFTFEVKNITIGSLLFAANTSAVSASASSITYQGTGELVQNGTGICFIEQSSCASAIHSGSFAQCQIDNPDYKRGGNNIICQAIDYDNIIGDRLITENLNASLSSFYLTTPTNSPPAIGSGSYIGFNVTIRNTGGLDWTDNVSVIVRYSKTGAPSQQYVFCSTPTLLPAGQQAELHCEDNVLTEPGSYDFRAYAVYNRRGVGTDISDPIGPITVSVINVTINIEFVGMEDGNVLGCSPQDYCDANYTRGMPADFKVRAFYGSNMFDFVECSGDSLSKSYCNAYFKIDDGAYEKLEWLETFWEEKYPTKGFQCESLHNLTVKVDRNGIEGITEKKLYISCVPRITVVPRTQRVGIGEKNVRLYNVTLWHPLDSPAKYDMFMSETKGIAEKWLRWYDGYFIEDLNISGIRLGAIDSRSFDVYLTYAGKTGKYEVNFMAIDTGTQKVYDTAALLYIYSEGLDEFQLAWLLVIMAGGAVIFSRISGTGKRAGIRKRRA